MGDAVSGSEEGKGSAMVGNDMIARSPRLRLYAHATVMHLSGTSAPTKYGLTQVALINQIRHYPRTVQLHASHNCIAEPHHRAIPQNQNVD